MPPVVISCPASPLLSLFGNGTAAVAAGTPGGAMLCTGAGPRLPSRVWPSAGFGGVGVRVLVLLAVIASRALRDPESEELSGAQR